MNKNSKDCCKTEINHILCLSPAAKEISEVKHKFKSLPKVISSNDGITIISGIIEKRVKYIDIYNNQNEIIEEIPFEDKIKCCNINPENDKLEYIEITELCRKLSGIEKIEGKTVYSALLEKVAVKIKVTLNY